VNNVDNKNIIEAGLDLLDDDGIDFATLRNRGFLKRASVAIREGYRKAVGVYGLSRKLRDTRRSPTTDYSMKLGEINGDIQALDKELFDIRYDIRELKNSTKNKKEKK
jgi:hypothetical protein